MKQIVNVSLQTWNLSLKSGGIIERVLLKPNNSIKVSDGQITEQVKTLAARRLIKIVSL